MVLTRGLLALLGGVVAAHAQASICFENGYCANGECRPVGGCCWGECQGEHIACPYCNAYASAANAVESSDGGAAFAAAMVCASGSLILAGLYAIHRWRHSGLRATVQHQPIAVNENIDSEAEVDASDGCVQLSASV